MFTRHVTRRLPRYVDGDVTPVERQAIDAHLSACRRCRGELDDIRFAAGLMRQLATVTAPPSLWRQIENDLVEPRHPVFAPALRWALTVAVLVLAAGAAFWWARNPVSRPWEVTTAANSRRLAAGEWVETPANSTARIIVGRIGTVDVEPGTRVRLGEVRPTEYRLSLARGTISAQIDAPPRLFIVDTPSSTVVDLGCAYTVTVADDGASELRMTEGWAALDWQGRESLVPAGAMCRTRPRVGPGLPYFEDAPASLRQAVDAFDAGRDTEAAVDVIIRDARIRDTLTLWHLLSRVEEDQRARVYDRIAALIAPPSSLARQQALELDAESLKLLREELAWHW